MHHFSAVFRYYVPDRVQRDIIRLTQTDMSYLEQNA